MRMIFWIALLVFVLWYIFRKKPTVSKHSSGGLSPKSVLQELTGLRESDFPASKRLSKNKNWQVRPNEIFRTQYISFSRIKSFETCPKMFELIYLYGFEDKSGRSAQVGSLVHEIIHLYTLHHIGRLSEHMRRNGVVEELLYFYDQAVSSAKLTHSIPKAKIIPYLKNFVELNRTNSFNILATEHECNSTIGIYKLKCIIDRIDVGPQLSRTIIDYKTGNPLNVVNRQLDTYAYALSNGKWTPLRLRFQFLQNGDVRDREYTQQLHHEVEQRLLQKTEEIENTNVFHRNKSRLCNYCGVSDHC